jgi:hypothetical protein
VNADGYIYSGDPILNTKQAFLLGRSLHGYYTQVHGERVHNDSTYYREGKQRIEFTTQCLVPPPRTYRDISVWTSSSLVWQGWAQSHIGNFTSVSSNRGAGRFYRHWLETALSTALTDVIGHPEACVFQTFHHVQPTVDVGTRHNRRALGFSKCRYFHQLRHFST